MSSDAPPPPTPPATTDPNSSGSSHGFHGMDDFFDRIRGLGVVRPSDGRWAAGVASGLARRWDLDVVLVRGIFVALTLMGGLGVAAYGIAWLLLPQTDGRIHLQNALRGHITAGFIGAVVLALSAIGGNGPGPWHDNYFWGWGFPGSLVLTVLIIGGIWWFARRENERNPVPAADPNAPAYGTATFTADPDRESGRPPTPEGDPTTWEHLRATRQEHREETRQFYDRRALTRPSRPLVRATLGIALLAAAAVALIGSQNDWSAPYGVIAAATALAVIGAGMLVSGVLGRRPGGLAALGVILAIATLIGAGAQNAGVNSGQNVTPVGQRTWRPTTVAAAEKQFNLGIGEATLDLTDPALVAGPTPVDVKVRTGIGHLTVVLPDTTSSQVNLRLSIGELRRPDGTTASYDPSSGEHRQTLTAGAPGAPELVVDVQHGIGQLDVTTASKLATLPGNTYTPTPSVTPSVTPSATPTATATTN